MLRFVRPPEPRDFASSVTALRAGVQATALLRRPGKEDLPARWRDYKPVFMAAQHGKCGYCESRVQGVCHGDVEHYRPKGEVQALPTNRADLGREVPHSSRAVERRPAPLSPVGYHWLAYEWTNYLLACQCCNEVWKGSLFPTMQNHPPSPISPETALLLNPFEGPNPVEHLSFDSLGQIEPYQDSLFGRATIDTCGLDRLSLVLSRIEKAAEAHRVIRVFRAALDAESDAEACEAGEALLRLGAEDAVHAGMVRAIVAHDDEEGLSWEELVTLVADLASGLQRVATRTPERR